MADIELVIKIPEEHFKKICANKEDAIIAHDTCRRIANGIPLPKGHGRIIDEDQIPGDGGWDFSDRLMSTQTIIEADTAESEDRE